MANAQETYCTNLIKKTVDTLVAAHAPLTLEQTRIDVPGLMLVLMQFCPKNPLLTWALSYTGKLNLVRKVQQRTLRAYSIDSYYVSTAYKYMRSYRLWLYQLLEDVPSDVYAISASCDDKRKVYTLNPKTLFRSTSESPHSRFRLHKGARLALCHLDVSLLLEIIFFVYATSPLVSH